jgi:raffinose synthase
VTRITLVGDELRSSGKALLTGVDSCLTAEPRQPFADGLFLRAKLPKPRSRGAFQLGRPALWQRYIACHRYEPFWMLPKAGIAIAELPGETQVLLVELESGEVLLLVPLVDAPFRAALRGLEGALELCLESGDPHVRADEALCLFVAVGTDPYELIPRAARAVAERLGTGRLRSEKPLPAFCDLFGWCTWDAFYQEVSHDKVREGLAAFQKGGISPRAMILDDGWQSVREMPTGERRLTAFHADAKFPGGLSATVSMAKQEFGLEQFWVWHAFHGYWGGVDGEALPGYDVREARRAYAPGILRFAPTFNEEWWGSIAGLVPPATIARFFDDYHAYLSAQGVDGVKVDNQAATESLASGRGGRVVLMQAYRTALEASVSKHFGGALINCMSNANEMMYAAKDSTLVRSSVDFWPDRPETHGMHLFTNAHFGVWFGEFVHADWDMFHSSHPWGPLHAAARAVSGSPVYVSDKPGKHDFALLKKLVTSDGHVLRARAVARPTLDCLFSDPTREPVLLKVFNLNVNGGVVGVFHCAYAKEGTPELSGVLRASDVHGLAGERFAIYAHYLGTLHAVQRDEAIAVTLAEGQAEVYTVAPIERGVAAIGLADKLNSGGAIISALWRGSDYDLELKEGGDCVLFAERAPLAAASNGAPIPFTHAADTRLLRVALPQHGPCALRLSFT